MNINILQIKCFLEVLATDNFSEAAEHLYMTQSTVSKKIASLEKELGLLLFERRGRRVYVTPAGRELAQSFNQLEEGYKQLETTVENIKRKSRSSENEVVIALIPFVEKLGIIPRIREFAEKHGNFVPIIHIVHERQMLFDTRLDMYDMLFCADRFIDTSFYKTAIHSSREFFLVMSAKNELAKKETISLKDLDGVDLVLLPAETMLQEYELDSLRRAGVMPYAVLQTDRTEIAREFIKDNKSVHMTIKGKYPDLMVPDIVTKDIVDSPKFNYAFSWKKESKHAKLIEECARYCIKHKDDEAHILTKEHGLL